MRLVNSVAVVSVALLLWSVVVGFVAWQYFKFVGFEAQLENVTKIQTQIVQYINNQQQQNGSANAAAAGANAKVAGR